MSSQLQGKEKATAGTRYSLSEIRNAMQNTDARSKYTTAGSIGILGGRNHNQRARAKKIRKVSKTLAASSTMISP